MGFVKTMFSVCIGAGFLFNGPAIFAADPIQRFWVGKDSEWNSASHWYQDEKLPGNPNDIDPNKQGVPLSGYSAQLKGGYAPAIPSVVYSSGASPLYHDIWVEGGVDLTQSGGTINTHKLELGRYNPGIFKLNNGSLNISRVDDDRPGKLLMGWGADGWGTFWLNGGALSAHDEAIGVYGNARFFQYAGSNTVTNDVELSHSTYEMRGGTLDIGNAMILACYANGSFRQFGGTVTIQSGLLMSSYGATGNFELSGDNATTLTAAFETIGWASGTSTFSQAGATTNTVRDDMFIGEHTDASGKYEIKDSARLDIGNRLSVGVNGKGTFTQTGGNVTARSITVGDGIGSTGTYTYQGGELGSKYGALDSIVLGRNGTGNFVQDGRNLAVDDLILGESEAGVGSYTLKNGGTLDVSWASMIGQNGAGSFVNDNGTHRTQYLEVGSGIGSVGTYKMNGGVLEVTNDSSDGLIVAHGMNSTGTFSQTGGKVTARNITVGDMVGSAGTYTYQGGTLVSEYGILESIVLGRNGTGNFVQDGRNLAVDDLILGESETGVGSYALKNGGTLDVSWASMIGQNGAGSFVNDNGTHRTQFLEVGSGIGSVGSYKMNGGVLEVTNDSSDGLIVAHGMNSTGTFTQTGGKVTARNITVGDMVGSAGTYTYQGGTLVSEYGILESIVLGRNGTGNFVQDGRNLAVHDLILGESETGVGTYTLNNGGTLDVSWASYIGKDGAGSFVHNNGTHRTQYLAVGSGMRSVGTYKMNGGVLEVTNDSSDGLIVAHGMNSTGRFIQTGGHVTAQNITIGDGIGSTGTYRMQEGTTEVGSELIVGKEGTGAFYLEGGTLKANKITVKDTFSYSGGIIHATDKVVNNGTFNISSSDASYRWIHGNMTNNGTLKVTNAHVEFTGQFINNGEYNSDPSVNNFNDLVINSTGYLIGGLGDAFNIAGDFENNSTQTGLWNTKGAQLGFVGAGLSHDYLLNTTSAQFDWGTLFLEGGTSLHVGGGFIGDLFFDTIILGGGIDQLLSLYSVNNIYYTSLYDGSGHLLDAATYGLVGGGNLFYRGGAGTETPVPEPSTMLLFGSAMLGLLCRKKLTT